MYSPKYTINNKILKSIGQVEAAKEVIENAPLVPKFEKQFKTDALVRTVHHGTHIEGNDLSLDQTRAVLEGEDVVAKERDVQEVINYRNVVDYLEELKEKPAYDAEMLKAIQRYCVFRIVPEDKVGVFRNTQVVIKNEATGEVIMRPPPAVQVEFMVKDFIVWLNSPTSNDLHPVIKAGIAHYILVAIHPFVEGNGRTARAFASLVLMREKYDIKRYFAIEEHFDNDPAAYYQAFAQVDKLSENIALRDLTSWLEYFTDVVAIELTKIKEAIRKLSMDSTLRGKIGEQIALSDRQMKLVEHLNKNGQAKMKDLKKVLSMVSEDTILRDLNDLIDKGLIIKRGKTKASRYMIVGK